MAYLDSTQVFGALLVRGSVDSYDGYYIKGVRVFSDTLSLENIVNLSMSGNLSVGGTASVTGAVTLGSTLSTGGSLTIGGTGILNHNTDPTYDKIRVWNSGSYAIGMRSGLTYGFVNNDYAMTFTMSSETTRGFIWRDTADAVTDGAMSLNTEGKLYVKHTVSSDILVGRGKRHDFGASTGWDAVGEGNQTNLHFNGHARFWIGAGNSAWHTGTAVANHHDLLITTMGSDATYTRGITFAVATNDTGSLGYRLGRWFSGTDQASSYLQLDSKLKMIGNIEGSGGETEISNFKNVIGRSSDGILHLKAGTSGGKIYLGYGQSGGIDVGDGTTQNNFFIRNGYMSVPAGQIGGINLGDVQIRSGSTTRDDAIFSGCKEIRFGDSTAWDYNQWAGLKYDTANTRLVLGGPNSTQLVNNTSAPTIKALLVGISGLSVGKDTDPTAMLDVAGSGVFTTETRTLTTAKSAGIFLDTNDVGIVGRFLNAGTPYYRDLIKATSSDIIQIGQNSTSIIKGVDVYCGDSGSTSIFRVYTSDAERFRVAKDGKVGIGVTNPSEMLDVNGNIELSNATSNNLIFVGGGAGIAAPSFSTRSVGTKIVLYPTVNATRADYAIGVDSSTVWYSVPDADSSASHKFYGATTELMRIRGDGNVGIGINPIEKLHVSGNAIITGTVNTNGGRLVLRDNSIEEQKTNANTEVAINYYGYSGGATQFRDLAIYDGKGNSLVKVQGSTARVGIGVTSPFNKLHVKGASGSEELVLQSGTDATNARHGIVFYGGDTNVEARILSGNFGSWNGGLIFEVANHASAATTTTEAMRIKNDGNVGIGYTDPTYKLHVNGTGYFNGAVTVIGNIALSGNITLSTNGATVDGRDVGSDGGKLDVLEAVRAKRKRVSNVCPSPLVQDVWYDMNALSLTGIDWVADSILLINVGGKLLAEYVDVNNKRDYERDNTLKKLKFAFDIDMGTMIEIIVL